MELVYNVFGNGSDVRIEEEIYKIYIIREDGDVLFPNDLIFKDMDDYQQTMFSNLMMAMQHFAQDLGDKEVSTFQIGSEKIYSKKDPITNITFIYKTDKKSKDKIVFNLLNRVINAFINKFTGAFNAERETKIKLMESFIIELENILEEKNKVNNFLSCL